MRDVVGFVGRRKKRVASYGLDMVLTYAGAVQYVAQFGQPGIRTNAIKAPSESPCGSLRDYIGAWPVPVLSPKRPLVDRVSLQLAHLAKNKQCGALIFNKTCWHQQALLNFLSFDLKRLLQFS